MAFLKGRKFTAGALVLTMLGSTLLTGFTYQDGIGNVYYETKTSIYDKAYYYKQLAGHGTNGIERAYYFTVDTKNSDLKPFVFEGEVTGNYTMNTMVSTLESQGYSVVCGVNGDLYDTSSGTPKGLTIHDGKIKTSGYAPEYVISFDQQGAASLEQVSMGYNLKATVNVASNVVTTPEAIDPVTGTVIPAASQTVYTPTEINLPIGFFNVPHGGAKALHLFNRQFAASTKTTEKSVEVILDAGSALNSELTVGGTISANVVEVRTNTTNTPIADNQLVLSTAADSACAAQLAQLIPGSTVQVSVTDWLNGNLKNSKEAMGIYYVLYHNGQFINNGTNLNPRTMIGIKADGTVLVYALDGRQAGFSSGLGLTDAAKHLVSLGCVTVLNMDGGGSTVMAVRKGGVDAKAVQENSPSGGTQRKTTNGLLFVYQNKGSSTPVNLHTYVDNPLAMPGADVNLKTYASNEKFEPVSVRNTVSYSMTSNSSEAIGSTADYRMTTGTTGSVSQNGVFTAGNSVGSYYVQSESGGLTTTTKIDVFNNIVFNTNVQNLVLDPGKTSNINVTAKYGYSPIASKDSLFAWSCDQTVGTIDKDGLFTASPQSGVSGNIYVEYNGVKKTIPVQVGALSVNFADTTDHWAKEYIGKLAARGIVNGMGDNYYLPDDNLTRAQFLTMLSKTIYGLDPAQSQVAGFTDVPDFEWYYKYVNWGFATGIVKGTSDQTFSPNEKITREQMAIMINNFTRSTELVLPTTNVSASFTDSGSISPWATDSVNTIVSSGIMGGYPEGNYDPLGNATRAQAATVIYKLINIRDNIAKSK